MQGPSDQRTAPAVIARERPRLHWLALLLLLASCRDAPPAPDQEPDLADRASSFEVSLRPVIEAPGRADAPATVEQRRAFYGVPGVAVVAWQNGEVVIDRSYGVRNLEGDPLQTTTPVEAGPLLSSAVSSLVIAAQFSEISRNLNAPIRQLAGELGLPPEVAALSIADLLGHRVSLEPSEVPPETRLDAFGPSVRIPQGAALGVYSQANFAVLQVVMEALALRPWDELSRLRLFDPVGLEQTAYWSTSPADAVVFDVSGRALPPVRHPAMAASGLTTSAADLARLLSTVQETLLGQRRDPFTPRQLQLTFEQHHGDWGLGWPIAARSMVAVRPRGSTTNSRMGLVWQWTGRHLVLVHLEQPRGIIVLTNGARGARLAEEILLAVGEVLDWPEISSVSAERVVPAADDLRSLIGRYNMGSESFTIEWADGELQLTGLNETAAQLVPRGPRLWTLSSGPQAVRLLGGETTRVGIDDQIAIKTSEEAQAPSSTNLLEH